MKKYKIVEREHKNGLKSYVIKQRVFLILWSELLPIYENKQKAIDRMSYYEDMDKEAKGYKIIKTNDIN